MATSANASSPSGEPRRSNVSHASSAIWMARGSARPTSSIAMRVSRRARYTGSTPPSIMRVHQYSPASATDEHDHTLLDVRQKRVLLRLVETVHFVDEQHRANAFVEARLRLGERFADFGDA